MTISEFGLRYQSIFLPSGFCSLAGSQAGGCLMCRSGKFFDASFVTQVRQYGISDVGVASVACMRSGDTERPVATGASPPAPSRSNPLRETVATALADRIGT